MKLFFTISDITEQKGISRASARVFCSRKASQGEFLRFKRDMYIRADEFARLREEALFSIANFLQVPSYVSCLSALSYYGLTTQVPRRFVESIALKRTVRFSVGDAVFDFKKIVPKLYRGFQRTANGFIATKEKALCDAVYLSSYGKYALDWSALEIEKFDRMALAREAGYFPERVQRRIADLWTS